MKTTLILGMIITSILLVSCNPSREKQDDVRDRTELAKIGLDNSFTLTIEDLREEQLEIEKKLNVLKNSDVERQAHDYEAFEPEIKIIESQMDSLKTYLSDFTNASEEGKEIVYEHYKIKREKITKAIEAIEERFNDLKVLDN